MTNSIQNNCSVYTNNKLLGSPVEQVSSKLPAQDLIGNLWARTLSASSNAEASIPLLGRLGVSPKDVGAREVLIPLMEKAQSGGVTIKPSSQDSGVYFLIKDEKPFAVFKAGTRRMCIETLARRIALNLGLEKHVIPGVYCSIVNPLLLPKDPIYEELWNGNVKVIKEKPKNIERPLTLTGILEPYISSDEAMTSDDMASMTYLAFLIGLRDGKKDGKFGSCLVDNEDIMPYRLLPGPGHSPNKSVASTHLPFLSDPIAKQPMTPEKLKELSESVNTIMSHIFQLLGELELEKVEFADLPSEQIEAKKSGVDQGGFPVKIVKQKRIMEAHPTIDVSTTDRLLSHEQLAAFYDRMVSMKKFIDLCVKTSLVPETPLYPSSWDLIKNADPMYGAHFAALQKHNPARVQTAADLVGAFSPIQTGSPLGPDDRKLIIEERNKTPSPPFKIRLNFNEQEMLSSSSSSPQLLRPSSVRMLKEILENRIEKSDEKRT